VLRAERAFIQLRLGHMTCISRDIAIVDKEKTDKKENINVDKVAALELLGVAELKSSRAGLSRRSDKAVCLKLYQRRQKVNNIFPHFKSCRNRSVRIITQLGSNCYLSLKLLVPT
jgi:hypothetical protein